MTAFKGLACDGCGSTLTWRVVRGAGHGLTKAGMEQRARNDGWQAPDKIGRHWCANCRTHPKPKRNNT